MIRQARPADLPEIVRMVVAFQREVLPGLPCHPTAVERTAQGLLATPRGYVALLELDGPRGLLMGHAARSPWAETLVADELVWWIDPARRGRWALRMIEDFEAWAGRVGAGVVGLSSTGADLGPLYTRRGYLRAETKYLGKRA